VSATASLSAIVAITAVIGSSVMQALTLRATRRNTILTLEQARKNTMASIVSADTQK
jgi:hypothetical protein